MHIIVQVILSELKNSQRYKNKRIYRHAMTQSQYFTRGPNYKVTVRTGHGVVAKVSTRKCHVSYVFIVNYGVSPAGQLFIDSQKKSRGNISIDAQFDMVLLIYTVFFFN